LADLIRSYDELYNGFIDSMCNLEKKQKLTVSTSDENELLNRISKLESEKIQTQNQLAKYTRNAEFLESRIQQMGQTQKEYQTINEKIQNEESFKNQALSYELESLKNEVKDLKKENLNLTKDNDELIEKLEKVQTTKRDEIKKMTQKNEKISNQIENLELMNKDYEVQISQLKNELTKKANEINNLNSKRNEYHKKYNMIQQLNKTNEATIRSLQKDISQSQEDATNSKAEIIRIKDTVKDLIRSWRMKGANKESMNELILHFGDAVTIHENLNDNMTICSIDDSKLDFNNNLKMLDEEYNGINLDLSQNSIRLESLSNLGSIFLKNTSQMKSLQVTRNSIPSSPMNFQKRNNISELQYGIDEDKESVEKDVIKDEMTKKMEREKFIREEFKTQLTEQLDNKINSRFKIKKKKTDILENLTINNPFESKKENEEMEESGIIQFEAFKDELKNKIFLEFDSFEQSVINILEKEHIKKKWMLLDNVQDSVIWIIAYFREKINEIHGKSKTLFSENSKKKIKFSN
jgi:myosin heavy subunit